MASVETQIYIEKAGTEFECTVTAEGDVSVGGSNGYGSDEPAWQEVADLKLFNSRGKPVSERFTNALTRADWDHIEEALVEAAADF